MASVIPYDEILLAELSDPEEARCHLATAMTQDDPRLLERALERLQAAGAMHVSQEEKRTLGRAARIVRRVASQGRPSAEAAVIP